MPACAHACILCVHPRALSAPWGLVAEVEAAVPTGGWALSCPRVAAGGWGGRGERPPHRSSAVSALPATSPAPKRDQLGVIPPSTPTSPRTTPWPQRTHKTLAPGRICPLSAPPRHPGPSYNRACPHLRCPHDPQTHPQPHRGTAKATGDSGGLGAPRPLLPVHGATQDGGCVLARGQGRGQLGPAHGSESSASAEEGNTAGARRPCVPPRPQPHRHVPCPSRLWAAVTGSGGHTEGCPRAGQCPPAAPRSPTVLVLYPGPRGQAHPRGGGQQVFPRHAPQSGGGTRRAVTVTAQGCPAAPPSPWWQEVGRDGTGFPSPCPPTRAQCQPWLLAPLLAAPTQ